MKSERREDCSWTKVADSLRESGSARSAGSAHSIRVDNSRSELRSTRGASRPLWSTCAFVVFLLFTAFPAVASAQTDSGQPRDITGIEELPPLPPPPAWPYWLAGCIIIGGLGGFGAWRIARYKPRPAPLPPDRWALRELERIAAQKLAEQGQAERFHTLVSDVIRRYLEARYDLRAPQQTTQEFLRGLPEPSPLPAERQEKLAEFLRRCDVAKFAPVTVAGEECRQVLELAQAVVTEGSVSKTSVSTVR